MKQKEKMFFASIFFIMVALAIFVQHEHVKEFNSHPTPSVYGVI